MLISRSVRLPFAALAGALLLSGTALAGGGGGLGSTFQSVQAGSWSDPASWDLGGSVPVFAANDIARIRHDLVVDAPGAGALSTQVGEAGGGSLRILPGGSLQSVDVITGLQGPATMSVEGGVCQPGQLRVGNQFFPVDFELSGGDLSMNELWISGSDQIQESPLSTFRVVGGAATASVATDTYVGPNGTIELRPTANGAAGLTTLVMNNVVFDAGSTLCIDPAYTAQIGDRWVVMDVAGFIGGMPNLQVVGPYLMAIDVTPAGNLDVVVLGDVFPGDFCTSPVEVILGPSVSVIEADLSLASPIVGGPTCVTGGAVADLWFRLENLGPAASATAEVVGPSSQVALEVYDACGGNVIVCGGSGAAPGAAAVTFPVPGDDWVLLRVSSPVVQDVDVAVALDGGWTELDGATTSTPDVYELQGTGVLIAGETAGISLEGSDPAVPVLAWLSLTSSPFDALGGTVYAFPYTNQFLFMTDLLGDVVVETVWPAGLPPGTDFWIQFICSDASAPGGLVLSNAIQGTTPVGSFP